MIEDSEMSIDLNAEIGRLLRPWIPPPKTGGQAHQCTDLRQFGPLPPPQLR